jgi:hypothetical protein
MVVIDLDRNPEGPKLDEHVMYLFSDEYPDEPKLVDFLFDEKNVDSSTDEIPKFSCMYFINRENQHRFQFWIRDKVLLLLISKKL